MEEEPIMCKRNLRLLVSLCTIVTFAFSNVTLTLQSNGNLDYDSDSDTLKITRTINKYH